MTERCTPDGQAPNKLPLLSTEQLRAILDTVGEGIISIDSNSTILMVNQEVLHIWGYDEAELLGQSLRILMPPEYWQSHQLGMRRLSQSGTGQLIGRRVELKGRRKDSSIFPLEIKIQSTQLDGQPIFTAAVRDISEQREAQESLRQANEQLGVWVTELKDRTRALSALNSMSEQMQACHTIEEAAGVLGNLLPGLFPGSRGGLYLLNHDLDEAELVGSWATAEGESWQGAQSFAADACLAVRKKSAHSMSSRQGPLHCSHMAGPAELATLCLPLLAEREVQGLLLIEYQAYPLDAGDEQVEALETNLRFATAVTNQLAVALTNIQLRESLRAQAIRDPLTDLFNRRHLESMLEREIRRALRNKLPVGVIMIDIDHFKLINDTLGHAAGDAVLSQLGRFLQSNIRGSDIACRYGGEEFILIVPETSLQVTYQRAEELRESVKGQIFQYEALTLRVTISIGVAAFPLGGATMQELLQAADTALYCAKAQGRDQVVAAEPVLKERIYWAS